MCAVFSEDGKVEIGVIAFVYVPLGVSGGGLIFHWLITMFRQQAGFSHLTTSCFFVIEQHVLGMGRLR